MKFFTNSAHLLFLFLLTTLPPLIQRNSKWRPVAIKRLSSKYTITEIGDSTDAFNMSNLQYEKNDIFLFCWNLLSILSVLRISAQANREGTIIDEQPGGVLSNAL